MSLEAENGLEDRLTPVLRPVRAGNGFEEALEQILQVVRLGLVPGGERLPAERELAGCDDARMSPSHVRRVASAAARRSSRGSRERRSGSVDAAASDIVSSWIRCIDATS